MQRIKRITKRTYRRKIAKATKIIAKKEVVKEEIEIAKVRFFFNSVIACDCTLYLFLQIFSRIL